MFQEQKGNNGKPENARQYKKGELRQRKPLLETIGKQYGYRFDALSFLELFDQIADRVEEAIINDGLDLDPREQIIDYTIEAIDEVLIWNADLWKIAQFHNASPADMDWEETINSFYIDTEMLMVEIFEEYVKC